MKTNQLFLAATRLLAKVFMAGFLGLMVGNAYNNMTEEVIINTDEAITGQFTVNDRNEIEEMIPQLPMLLNKEFDNDEACFAYVYTYGVLREPKMNTYAILRQSKESSYQITIKSKVINKPMVPPPRQNKARSDMTAELNTS